MEKEKLNSPDEFDIVANNLNLDIQTRLNGRKLLDNYKLTDNFKVIRNTNF